MIGARARAYNAIRLHNGKCSGRGATPPPPQPAPLADTSPNNAQEDGAWRSGQSIYLYAIRLHNGKCPGRGADPQPTLIQSAPLAYTSPDKDQEGGAWRTGQSFTGGLLMVHFKCTTSQLEFHVNTFTYENIETL